MVHLNPGLIIYQAIDNYLINYNLIINFITTTTTRRQSYNLLMLCAFPESPESPNRPIGLFGVLGVVPNEGSIAHASMSGFASLA